MDAAVRDGLVSVPDASLESGPPTAPEAGARPIELSACADFDAVWAQRQGACRQCTDQAEGFACDSVPIGDDCSPAFHCVRRHCICDRPLGQGDCDQSQTAQVCGCIDSCLVLGENPCRSGWSEWMACIVKECAGVCGL